jgi:hypothetical protein
MASPSRKADWPIITALLAVLVFVPLAVYVWGYFACSTPTGYGQTSMRMFRTRLETKIYEPAAQVEWFFVGHRVTLLSFDSLEDPDR